MSQPQPPTVADLDWRSAQSPPSLDESEIHIWSVCLDRSEQDIEFIASFLNEYEQKKAARFKFDIHRQRYTVSRVTLRWLVSQYTGIAIKNLQFSLGPLGKPSLPEPIEGRELCFNASDSKDKALFAFAWDCELGIDLETFPRRMTHMDNIARRHFSPDEVDLLSGFPPDIRNQAFLAAWTRKEAYGKALGVGIRYRMQDITTFKCLDSSSIAIYSDNQQGQKEWRLFQIQPDFDGIATLVASTRLDNHILSFTLPENSLQGN